MFKWEITDEAIEDLLILRKTHRRRILDGIERQLVTDVTMETRNRKRLRPNTLAEWELRIGEFRVFYDLDWENNLIKVLAVGYKEGNQLYVRGRKYQL